MTANAAGEAETGPLRLHFDRTIKLVFQGSSISSDSGLLLHRELDDALGLTDTAAEMLSDPRTGRPGQHELGGSSPAPSQCWRGLAGWEDVNDADAATV